jgi:hypothetical protein
VQKKGINHFKLKSLLKIWAVITFKLDKPSAMMAFSLFVMVLGGDDIL